MRQQRSNLVPASFGRVLTRPVLEGFYFPHLCDLYAPSLPVVDGNNAAQDVSYVKVYTGQKLFLQTTPETDEAFQNAHGAPLPMGRTKTINIFTLDMFLFPSGVVVRDTYVMHFLTPGDYYGAYWSLLGNAQSDVEHPFHLELCQMIYGKRIAKPPPGVS